MKNKLLLGALLMGTAAIFTACSDDNDSNPQLVAQPAEFALNVPAYATETVDLQSTNEMTLTWSQPRFTADNAPLQITYEIQVSPTNSYTISAEQASADDSGATIADYATLPRTTTQCSYTMLTTDLMKAIMQVTKWNKSEVPAELVTYLRINAFVLENGTRLNSTVSNSIKIAVNPYYIELKDAEPIMWYFVGNNILDGAWGNNPGVSSLPMFKQSDYAYDKATGTGEITYLNYFTTDGWKIQPADFNWDLGFMSGGEANTAVFRDKAKDAGNIWCDPAGYYLVTVNTLTNTCTIKNQDITPTDYGTVCIAGSFNSWSNEAMTPANKSGENHVWTYTLTVAAGETVQLKFNDNGSTWWGYGSTDGSVNLCGKATTSGANLGLEEGTWVICFNDITGEFSIIAKQ